MTPLDLLRALLREEQVAWPRGSASDERRFLELAADHRLTCLAAEHVRKLRHLSYPESIAVALKRALHDAVVIEQVVQRELCHVLDALDAARVDHLLFKGTGLAYTHYAHPWLRPRVDTDLFVREAGIGTIREVLLDLGYRFPRDLPGRLISYQVCCSRRDSLGFEHTLDIHWRMSNTQAFAHLIGFDEARELSDSVRPLGEHTRCLGSIHAMLLACMHRAHHRDTESMLWVYDIHLLASRMGRQQLEQVLELSTRWRVCAACRAGLAHAEEWFHTKLPKGLLAEFATRARRGSGEPTERFLLGRQHPIDELLLELQALPRWRDRLELIREHLFPPALNLLERHGMTNRVLFLCFYLHRVLDLASRFFRYVTNRALAAFRPA